MNKRSFRPSPSSSTAYPSLAAFVARRGKTLLGLTLLAASVLPGCVDEDMMGAPLQPRAEIDYRTDGGEEAGPKAKPDGGPVVACPCGR